MYGHLVQVSKDGYERLLVLGLSDLGTGLEKEDHPIVMTKNGL